MTAKRAAVLQVLREGGHMRPDEIYAKAKETQ